MDDLDNLFFESHSMSDYIQYEYIQKEIDDFIQTQILTFIGSQNPQYNGFNKYHIMNKFSISEDEADRQLGLLIEKGLIEGHSSKSRNELYFVLTSHLDVFRNLSHQDDQFRLDLSKTVRNSAQAHPDASISVISIPKSWRILGFLLPKDARERSFEPAYWELIDDYIATQTATHSASEQRRLTLAFSLRVLIAWSQSLIAFFVYKFIDVTNLMLTIFFG